MSGILQVQWTVTPITAPQPIRPCNSCKRAQPFRSSRKFRLNANGKRLDAWLIYKCAGCGSTWNLPVFERRNVREIDPEILQALQSNDPALADTLAFDIGVLRPYAHEVLQSGDVAVHKQTLSLGQNIWSHLDILIEAPRSVPMRTDRLLARELKLPRKQQQRLSRVGQLGGHGLEERFLRRPVRDGMRLVIDLRPLENQADIARAAAGAVG